MTNRNSKAITIAVLAALSVFLLLGVSVFLFPDGSLQQAPAPLPGSKPEPILSQITWTISMLGFTALTTGAAVGALLLYRKTRR